MFKLLKVVSVRHTLEVSVSVTERATTFLPNYLLSTIELFKLYTKPI